MKKVEKAKPVSTRQLLVQTNERISQLVHRIGKVEANQAGKDEVEIRIPEKDFLHLASEADSGARAYTGQSTSINKVLGAGSPPSPGHINMIGKMLAELSGTQDATHNLIDEILKAFDPALIPQSPATPSPIDGAGSGGPSMSSGADTVLNRIRVQRSINTRLRDLLDRNSL